MNILGSYLARLVNCAFSNTTPPDIPSEITFDELFDIAARNHMEYIVFSTLVKTNLPEEKKEILRNRVKISMMRTMVQVKELNIIKSRFEENGIVNQPMKGACMKFIYPNPMMREMSDIDILVRDEYMSKAQKIFEELDYTSLGREHHHDIYIKRPYMVVEAHWAMYDETVDKKQYEYFSDFSKAVLVDGKSYTYNFNKEDFYIYMMAHMAKHFYKKGCGIRNLVDVYVYRKKYEGQLNETYIEQELEKCGILSFTKHMEKMSEIWLNDAETTKFYNNLFSYMLDSGIYGKDENGIWNEFAKECGESRFHYSMKLKLFYYFPPYHYMVKYYPWIKGKKIIMPIAWIIRAISGLVNKKGEKKKEMLHHIDSENIRIIQNIYKEMQFDFK